MWLTRCPFDEQVTSLIEKMNKGEIKPDEVEVSGAWTQ